MTPKKAVRKKAKGFTAEERAAMKDRVKEMKGGGEGEGVVLAKIAAMKEPDRALAKRVHAIVMASASGLVPRLWYGMPAYAKDGKTVCFFQDAHKFKSRYATLGFSDKASLDEGAIWPVAFAVKELTPEAEGIIRALLKRALGL
ncbi:MAG TPA: hypothetical protein VL549_04310 [Gemmatimonadales bacterium]|jgi:uncharacterized protein YdhG (YjbR/CyaY superfamily)|nr:hypothetical protein [Gemmatimonadales bacterium]